MKNKKTIIALSIISCFYANAQDFTVIVDQQNNSYTVDNLKDTGNTRCSTISPLSNDVYKDESFTQNHSDCEKEQISSTGHLSWTDIPDITTTEIGTHLESSCKDILSFDNSLNTDKSYPVIGGETLNCLMSVDNGGWTEVAHVSGTYSATAPTVNIDDKGISHTQMLYVDNNSVSDLSYGDPNWIWQGMDFEKNLIKTGGLWNTISGARGDTCLNVPNSLPSTNYTMIENNITTCLWGSSNDPSKCGRKVKVDIPNGQKFEGFGDIESIYQSCNANNYFVLDYKLYIR